MTKVTILGDEAQGAKKPIEFKYSIGFNASEARAIVDDATWRPKDFKFIELISLTERGFDLMFAHDGDRSKGGLYIGHFNDGVV